MLSYKKQQRMEVWYMIHYFSKRVADFCLYKNVIAAERYALYVYGTELLISSFISLLTLVIISIILGTFKESVLFFLAFVSLRKTGRREV